MILQFCQNLVYFSIRSQSITPIRAMTKGNLERVYFTDQRFNVQAKFQARGVESFI